jgi:hypothetical protein
MLYCACRLTEGISVNSIHLLALNLERAAAQGEVPVAAEVASDSEE